MGLSTYPNRAGYKGDNPTGRTGAARVNPTLGQRQAEAFDGLQRLGEGSADQVAAQIGRHWYVTRPRLSELKALGMVVETGRSVASSIGGRTTVYRVATAEDRALHAARKVAEREHRGKNERPGL